jgi:Fe-S oxidoreductase
MAEHRLPLVRPHEREHTYCAFCPKLCRFSCPVSTVQARETTTPWGKMTALHHVAHGSLPMEPAYARTWWACTGCMRCRTFCDHGNEVAVTLNAGRAEAVRAGTAPEAAYGVIDTHADREHRARVAAHELFGDRMQDGADVAVVPGCTSTVIAGSDARSGVAATDSLLGKRARVAADGCCGLPLLEAGDRDGFVRAAQRFVDSLARASRVVFLDPGCLFALARMAPAAGVDHGIEMLHLVELAAKHLGRLGTVAIDGPVRYHDACRLGRGMGIYDPPRVVLGRILGRAPNEFSQTRDRAECSGAGGQLPRTDRDTASAIADERLADHSLMGGGAVVTACAASKRALEKRGARAIDLNALIGASIA